MKTVAKTFLHFVFSVLIILYSIPIDAQNLDKGRFEVIVSGGGGAFLPISRTTDEPHGKLGYSIIPEIRFSPNKWLSLGVTGLYQNKEDEETWDLGITAYGYWFSGRSIRLYSGIGYRMLPKIPSLEDGIQITPIGCALGKTLFGFVEIGAGSHYFPVRAGIGYPF